MSDFLTKPTTAFIAHRLLAAGPLIEVALAVKGACDQDPLSSILTFDDATGRVIDLDLRGTKADVIIRLAALAPTQVVPPQISPTATPPTPTPLTPPATTTTGVPDGPRGRGRPKLGVVAREVTLLPRHWDWLGAQPGGASVALRKLVEEARRNLGPVQRDRVARDAAYQAMAAMAGDFAGFEAASRALFARDRAQFTQHCTSWPVDIHAYILRIGFPDLTITECVSAENR